MNNSLHPIGEISDSIKLSGEQRVRLTRVFEVSESDKSGSSTDPLALVRSALAEPLDLPPLSAATVPGDRVAIAVGDGVPHVGEVVRGAVESFEKSGIQPEAISIVATSAETVRRCREELTKHDATLPQFVVHDPDDNDNLCLVGLTKRKEPLVVNRTIFDADIVLPIGCARSGGGAYDFVFPNFSSAEAIGNYRTPETMTSPEDVAKKAQEADEAGWLIGVLMTIQIVPGANEAVAHVVAGEPQAVARRCTKLYDKEWSLRCLREVSLVIAIVSGGAESQNWQNVGRALAVAAPLLDDGGAVAICSNLETPPGESLGRLLGGGDLEKAQRKIFHDRGEDSLPAWHVAQALQRGPVYFLSQLDPDTVEELGLAPIANIDELARLAGRRESYVVIDDVQHAIVTVD